MKKFAVIITLAITTLSFAQKTGTKVGPPAGNAAIGDVYGAPISAAAEKNAISPATLEKKLTATPKVEKVAVKGQVTEVCDKKGCWITVATDSGEKFFVKMKDYAFFVPTALKGKNVVLEGSAETKVTSVEEQRHYAEDAKKSQAEMDAITEAKQEIRFVASGIKVVD